RRSHANNDKALTFPALKNVCPQCAEVCLNSSFVVSLHLTFSQDLYRHKFQHNFSMAEVLVHVLY
ncbi:hypothetical protein BgiBS90_029537, partial [Biomphalaria glabrata]